MSEALRRNSWLAPWIMAAITILIQVTALSYTYGQLSQRQDEDRRRILALEASDHDQGRQLRQADARLARIEEGVAYIRDAVRSGGR